MPRETLERAIKKGSGQLDEGLTFETVVYEGFAPHQVAVIVECLTDNKNRTAPNMRLLFKRASSAQAAPCGGISSGPERSTRRPGGGEDPEERRSKPARRTWSPRKVARRDL